MNPNHHDTDQESPQEPESEQEESYGEPLQQTPSRHTNPSTVPQKNHQEAQGSREELVEELLELLGMSTQEYLLQLFQPSEEDTPKNTQDK